MIGGSDIWWGGIAPALVAAAMLAIVWRATDKAASAWRTALVLGYVFGHWALDARTIGVLSALTKSFRATEARDWLPLLMLLAILPDALACIGKRGPVVGWVLRAALCAFVPWRLLHGSKYLPLSLPSGFDFDMGGWSTGEATMWIGGIGAALLAAWSVSRIGDPQDGAIVRSSLALLVALGAAITTALSASLTYGQMFGVLTAGLGGCGLLSAIFSTGRGPEAAAGPLIVSYGGMLVVAHFFAELKLQNAALLLFAMVVAIGWLPLPAKLSPRWRAVCRAAVCFAALVTAVTLAGLDFAATQVETEVNPYQGYQ